MDTLSITRARTIPRVPVDEADTLNAGVSRGKSLETIVFRGFSAHPFGFRLCFAGPREAKMKNIGDLMPRRRVGYGFSFQVALVQDTAGPSAQLGQ